MQTPAASTWKQQPGTTAGKTPPGPVHQVSSPASAVDQDEIDSDSTSTPSPLQQPRPGTQGSIPTINDVMMPAGTPVPPRPPISH
jgi:hypothetical protein